MKQKFSGRLIPTVVVLLAVIAGMLLVFGGLERYLLSVDSETRVDTGKNNAGGRIFYDGAWYASKDALETILIMGIDTVEDTGFTAGSSDRSEEGMGQADFLELLILDKENQEFRLLHINRDTMAEIFQTDMYGRNAGSFRGQLALAHAYGRDPDDGCRQTVKSVENLLYGISIDHYISLTMDAVSILNDKAGGVTLTLLDDFTHLDPNFHEGAVVTLTGEQALVYVRERGALDDSSNLRRMERQRQYMDGLFTAFRDSADAMDEAFSMDALLEVNAYMVSDCTADQLSDLTEILHQYAYAGIHTLEGESVMGQSHMEFHLDDAAAQKTVLDLFYTLVPAE